MVGKKATSGSVVVRVNGGRLRIVFSHGGRRYFLPLRRDDTPANRRYAQRVAIDIERDIALGIFDTTLAKYKPSKVKAPDEEVLPLTLKDIWDKFLAYKRPQCAQNTMDVMYNVYTGYLQSLPTHDLERASDIIAFAIANIPLNSAKRFLTRLAAALDWAGIKENPFRDAVRNLKLPKSKSGDTDIHPFSIEERDAILEALLTDKFVHKQSASSHSYYYPVIRFLFATGCRTSEAIALVWGDIDKNCTQVNFSRRVITTSEGRISTEGLKTQQKRIFPCNQSLSKFLLSIKPSKVSGDELVFPGFKGGFIDLKNFRARQWKKILNGLGIEYRKLYQTRHSFISLCLEKGIDAKDIARWVGNSPETIYRHYAGSSSNKIQVPEL